MNSYISSLQNRICNKIEEIDGKKFYSDIWEREEGGGGRSNIILEGNIFEKGGVNISWVHGALPKEIASHFGKKDEIGFTACGLSLVVHPDSPRIPTIHMNVRYFETEDKDSWFGGGIDLTPYYPYEEDFIFFHKTLRNTVDRVLPDQYQKYKEKCDHYFFIKHREEMRGVGGIFFDYLKENPELYFKFVRAVGDDFLKAYIPILEKRKNEKFSQSDKDFQLIQRGRYAEFNLVYDRGTLFGLKTNGRIESILMPLPPYASFPYNYSPPEGSVYQKMMKYYQATDWVDLG